MENENELYWAAGFFDGEGWAGVIQNPNGRLQLQIRISQVHIEPLERFQAVIGGTLHGPFLKKNSPRAQPIHQWYASGKKEEVRRMALLLLPKVSKIKRQQIENCLAKISTQEPYERYKRGECKQGHVWTPETTMIEKKDGKYRGRKCRICANKWQRENARQKNNTDPNKYRKTKGYGL